MLYFITIVQLGSLAAIVSYYVYIFLIGCSWVCGEDCYVLFWLLGFCYIFVTNSYYVGMFYHFDFLFITVVKEKQHRTWLKNIKTNTNK